MFLLLEKVINYTSKIIDFGIDPMNKMIITTGEKLTFTQNDKKKEISGKIKNSEIIKYIKEQNQLFVSNRFFVSTINGKVFKCDSLAKKVKEEVFDVNKILDYLNITTSGKIIYVTDNYLFSKDTVTGRVLLSDCLKNKTKNGNYKIFVSGENIIVKYRELHSTENTISIFDNQLTKIFEVKTENNHIFSKIDGLEYISCTENGEIEIWNILDQELYNSIKVTNNKVTFIEKYKEKYVLGLSNGEIFICNNKFKIIEKYKVSKEEIRKILFITDEMYVLSGNKIYKYKIIEDSLFYNLNNFKNTFMRKYKIHSDYTDFFTLKRIVDIENFLAELKIENVDYTPSDDKIFRALTDSIDSRKICLIGKDPYFQKGVATGLSFEVEKESWEDPQVNTSLKNMLKLIYKTYTGKYEDIKEIRNEIKNNDFKILPPNELFVYWKNNGVLLLNSALTTVVGSSGAHHQFWNNFTHELIEYISERNNRIVYFLWGKDAEIFEKNILSGDIIKHNHPAICGDLKNKKDFLNGNSFINTINIINWTGYDISEYEKYQNLTYENNQKEKNEEHKGNGGRLF